MSQAQSPQSARERELEEALTMSSQTTTVLMNKLEDMSNSLMAVTQALREKEREAGMLKDRAQELEKVSLHEGRTHTRNNNSSSWPFSQCSVPVAGDC